MVASHQPMGTVSIGAQWLIVAAGIVLCQKPIAAPINRRRGSGWAMVFVSGQHFRDSVSEIDLHPLPNCRAADAEGMADGCSCSGQSSARSALPDIPGQENGRRDTR
jgi:hypothetical protein